MPAGSIRGHFKLRCRFHTQGAPSERIFQCFLPGSGFSQRLWQDAQLPPQPSPFQPPCLEIHTTASANRMTRTISVMIPRSVNIFSYLFSGRKGFRIQYTRFCPEGQREAKRKSVIFLKLGLAFWQRPCYNNHVPVRNAQSKTKYGGLAQLVRAPASHAGGLGFESLILHQMEATNRS